MLPARDRRPEVAAQHLVFGQFVFDTERGELFCDGERVPLRPKATSALALLLENDGRLVSRAELRRHLWAETALDWNQGLGQVIRQIRSALSDDARSPRFIETVSGRGYRFLAEVAPYQARPEPANNGHAGRGIAFVAGAATALGIPVLFLLVCGLLASAV